MAKKFWGMTAEEHQAIAQEAVRKAIAEHHAAGRYTTHGDNKGIYRLFPDGHKEYIELYDQGEKK